MADSSDRPTRASRPTARAALALATGFALALVLACGEPEPPPEPVSPRPAAQPAPRALTPEELAEQLGDTKLGEAGTMPEDFPEDLPLYPEARPTRWMAATGSGALVAFESDAAPDTVYDYYTAELPESGWEIESKMSTGGHWTLSAVKAGRKARISIGRTDQGSQFGIAVASAD